MLLGAHYRMVVAEKNLKAILLADSQGAQIFDEKIEALKKEQKMLDGLSLDMMKRAKLLENTILGVSSEFSLLHPS